MKIDTDKFRCPEGKKIRLSEWRTSVDPYYNSKSDYTTMLADQVATLDKVQQMLYADDSYAILLIFQAMDAAGKDGVIRHVMSGVNPQGCQVFSYRHPSAQELDHDFLWRCTRDLPERGRIGIFNRSYYEEVLIVRVHPEILKAEGLPDLPANTETVWRHRYRSINGLERYLHSSVTRVLKFFLHKARDEQRKRFLDRIDEPEKNWKFSRADIEERAHWDKYMEAYEACLAATSSKHAPWYIVPADDKLNARLIVSQVVVDTLSGLKLQYPTSDGNRRRELEAIREVLLKEG